MGKGLTPQEEKELAELEKEVGKQAAVSPRLPEAPGGLSPQEADEMKALEGEVGHLVPKPYDPSGGANDLKGQDLINFYNSGKDVSARGRQSLSDVTRSAGQLADYGGGLVRTTLAAPANLVTKKPVVGMNDVVNALGGQAPRSKEYMSRMGVPEGPKVPEWVPGVGGTSARDAAGFVGDVATDPLTVGAMVERKLLGPLSEGAELAGKSTYKSGLKKIDERLIEKGKTPFSDIMLENGAPVGTTKTIAKKADELAADLATQRKGLYDQATQKGVTVDLGYPLEKTEALLAKMRDNPGLTDVADALEAKMLAYKKAGKVPIDKLSDWKSQFYDALPSSAFGPDGRVNGPAKQFMEAMSSDFRNLIEQAGNKAEKGLGDKIADVNDRWSSLIEARKPLDMQIRRGVTKNAISPLDAGLMVFHPGIEAAKKAAEIGNLTAARTAAGKGLMNAGKSGLLDAVARQGLINKKKKGLVDSDQPGPLQMTGDQ